MPRLRRRGSRITEEVRTGQVTLCACRASMRLLLAGDTHARPPRGQTHVHRHAVAVWYCICCVWARSCTSACVVLRPGPGAPSPGREGVRTIPPSDTPCILGDPPRVSCCWMTTRHGPCRARHGPMWRSRTTRLVRADHTPRGVSLPQASSARAGSSRRCKGEPMVRTLIDLILDHRLLVVALAVGLLLGGLYAFQSLNIEAYPDPSPPTIEVIAQNPGWSAEEMERQITVPIEAQLNGMPGLDHLRSISLFGLTDIKCYFKYDTDYAYDRQEVLNRLQMVQLPPGVQPQLSPTSAVGEIYRYQLVGTDHSLMALKVAQDWILERQFKQVPGVIDVVSFGGPTKEFHVELDPNKLVAFNVSISQVLAAIANSNANVGANYLELGVQSYNVRGIGLFKDAEDIANVAVPVSTKSGAPVYIKQLGDVSIGAKVSMGRVGKDNEDDIVQGVVLMRRGEKSLPTLERVRQKVEQLNRGILPKGMRIVPYYDRTDLIKVTTHTVTHTLIEGMGLVGFILLAFLGDLRAALVVALSIPLSLLFTFVMMVIR